MLSLTRIDGTCVFSAALDNLMHEQFKEPFFGGPPTHLMPYQTQQLAADIVLVLPSPVCKSTTTVHAHPVLDCSLIVAIAMNTQCMHADLNLPAGSNSEACTLDRMPETRQYVTDKN